MTAVQSLRKTQAKVEEEVQQAKASPWSAQAAVQPVVECEQLDMREGQQHYQQPMLH